tara:strand:- start:276 stop:551 length:276 start_codon:yes stop_codon:yes gene_type:complete
MNTIELIKDICLFGGSLPKERTEEVRLFLEAIKETNPKELNDKPMGFHNWCAHNKYIPFNKNSFQKDNLILNYNDVDVKYRAYHKSFKSKQ